LRKPEQWEVRVDIALAPQQVASATSEYCFLWIDHWSLCMTRAEWSGWVQALGSVAAIVFAVLLPLFLERRKRRKEFVDHLRTIATDVRLADRQATVYLGSVVSQRPS
jgi:hypothetical protein